jgi:hypothetical protein
VEAVVHILVLHQTQADQVVAEEVPHLQACLHRVGKAHRAKAMLAVLERVPRQMPPEVVAVLEQ